MDLTDELAGFIVDVTFADFPDEIIQKAKVCFLDSLGSTIAGSQVQASKLAAEFAYNMFGSGKSQIVGTTLRVSPIGAAWANGTSTMALDIDDVHRGATGHPGAVIFPAALAFAQSQIEVSGKRFLEAVMTAYEVGLRIALSRREGKRFSFSTGSWGAFASVIAAGKVLNLDKRQMAEALRITTAHHPLPPIRKSYRRLGMVKEVTGWACMTGSSAAVLAQQGFSGMESVLDDSEYHDASAFRDLGKNHELGKVGFKIYPSCRWNHAVLDAVFDLRRKCKIEPKEIKEVIVKTFSKPSQMINARPESIEDAQYALPFLVSLALSYGKIDLTYFSENHIKNAKDAEVLELASKVRLEFDPYFESFFPSQWKSSVEIITDQGRFQSSSDMPRGEYETPLSLQELKEKFRDLAKAYLKSEDTSSVIDLVLTLEKQENFDWCEILA